MSNFLRQFHIISSLKTNSERDVYPFYKVISPILSRHPAVRRMQTQSIGKNLSLRTLGEPDKEQTKKPLAVILSWMMAKESHIDKFRSVYASRGFDVLTVSIAPKDLLFPASGSQVVAGNVLEYIAENKQYEDVLVHAFSVGGYLMGEMFVQMREKGEKYSDVSNRIRGVVLDSAVDFEGIPTGFPRALSRNPITVRVLEWYVNTHLALMYNVATRHYMRSSKNFHNTPLRCPALMFVSEADSVGNPAANQMVAENWQLRGCDVRMKCWKDSKHVSHMYKHQDEYIAELDSFLSKTHFLGKRG